MELMRPGGFGQNIFGWTKGNFNSWQIGHNSQQIEQLTADGTNCLDDTTKLSTINNFVHCDGYLSNIAVGSTIVRKVYHVVRKVYHGVRNVNHGVRKVYHGVKKVYHGVRKVNHGASKVQSSPVQSSPVDYKV